MTKNGPVAITAREEYFALARSQGEMARALYKTPSGADKITAVIKDLEATAFRMLGMGANIEEVIANLRSEWIKFCVEKNKEVNAAPKLKSGPMSGCSSIHYKHADPGKADSSEVFIRNMKRVIDEKVRDAGG